MDNICGFSFVCSFQGKIVPFFVRFVVTQNVLRVFYIVCAEAKSYCKSKLLSIFSKYVDNLKIVVKWKYDDFTGR